MSTPDAGKMRSGEQEACCMGFVTSNGADHEPGCHNARPSPLGLEPPTPIEDLRDALETALDALVNEADPPDNETGALIVALLEHIAPFDHERADDEMPGTVTASVPIPLHTYVAPESTADGLGCAYVFATAGVRCNLPPGMHRLLKSTAGR